MTLHQLPLTVIFNNSDKPSSLWLYTTFDCYKHGQVGIMKVSVTIVFDHSDKPSSSQLYTTDCDKHGQVGITKVSVTIISNNSDKPSSMWLYTTFNYDKHGQAWSWKQVSLLFSITQISPLPCNSTPPSTMTSMAKWGSWKGVSLSFSITQISLWASLD